MSDTLRSEEALRYTKRGTKVVHADFARTLERELLTGIEMILARDRCITELECALARSRSRELALRGALKELQRIDMGKDIGGNCRFLPRAAGVIDAALTQPAPPVVPKSVADGLAEALGRALNILNDQCYYQDTRDALGAPLAAYREATKL